MLTGEIRGQIERLRKNLWEGGVANPLTNVEQITYLLFAKRIDEIQTLEENKAIGLRKQGYVARRIFPDGKDGLETPGFKDGGCPYGLMRWSKLKNEAPERMFEIVDAHLMPFLRTLGGAESVMASHMKGARLAFTKPALLDKLIQGLDEIPMDDRDTKGDVYEYLLSMISSAGENGQFRTPRHIIDLMVRLMNPGPEDTVCDPAAGTAGFLMMAAEHVRRTTPDLYSNAQKRRHFETAAFTGFDFDETMLRIGAMNMMLHGVDEPRITYRDSLAEGSDSDAGRYTMILANPPFSGSLDTSTVSKSLLKIANTGKTELLFIALFLQLLTTGGRAAVIVPNGVLEADTKAARLLREKLVRENTIEAIISLPHWIFKPYASVATSIIVFTKSGSTDRIMFVNMTNDGFADDARKTPIEKSQIDQIIEAFERRNENGFKFPEGLVRFVDCARIEAEDFDLCPRFYLLEHSFSKAEHLVKIGDMFDIYPGNLPATAADDGDVPFATSAKEIRRASIAAFSGPAICIPTVSATGHGHAAIKMVHYMPGAFSAATITAVLVPKNCDIDVHFYYNLLLSMKDEVLVSLMRGATNVTLNIDRLRNLAVPSLSVDQRSEMLSEITISERRLDEITAASIAARRELERHRSALKAKFELLG